jgi:hypothetical protein
VTVLQVTVALGTQLGPATGPLLDVPQVVAVQLLSRLAAAGVHVATLEKPDGTVLQLVATQPFASVGPTNAQLPVSVGPVVTLLQVVAV